ncbi:hypothetical protein HZS_7202 [Henneguya salminicola]|nr:hypothetical protein HZS_7202 [Henneguya salminicola]
MDEEKKQLDLWQKSNILLKKESLEEYERINIQRLKFIILDQTFSRDETLCSSYEEIYHETYSDYCCLFNKIKNNFMITQQKSDSFLVDFDPSNLTYLNDLCDKVATTNAPYTSIHPDEYEEKNNIVNNKFKDFKTANDKLIESKKRNQGIHNNGPSSNRKKTGDKRFISPLTTNEDYDDQYESTYSDDIPQIKGIDKKLIELILNDVVDKGTQITWNDIAGLDFAKKTIEEIIVWPMVRPDLFTGLLIPAKGLLLFGPPGTGKTLIGKCIANQCNAKFFSISASSLTSKWFGEGEKLVRALFEVAKFYQPSVVFMDEVDSLLSSRKDGEHESTRRIKTEFLVQLSDLIIRPQELDDAARRRFVKRLYVPLPEETARTQLISNLLSKQSHSINQENIDTITQKTKGYSGADMMNLCKEAALGPIRDIKDIANANANDVRSIMVEDFYRALKNVKPSVGPDDIQQYIVWNQLYGSCDSRD